MSDMTSTTSVALQHNVGASTKGRARQGAVSYSETRGQVTPGSVILIVDDEMTRCLSQVTRMSEHMSCGS